MSVCGYLPIYFSYLFLFRFSLSYMAAPITHFVSFEIFGWDSMLRGSFLAALWHWTFIAVLRMEIVIYMALEVGRAVKPRAGANKDSAVKPAWAIVAIGSAAVGSGFKVTVGAFRGYADFDGYLGLSFGRVCSKAETGNSS
jgi:hypothetical protein